MKLFSIIQHNISDKSHHIHIKSFLCVYVESPDGSKHWYRVGKKLFNAMHMYKKEHGYMPYKQMRHCYIIVPLTPYFANHKASMGVGRIIRFKFKKVPNTMLCCRSQFVLPSALNNNFYSAYKYLRHDYGRFNRFQIFINLYNWKHKESKVLK